MRLLQTQKDGSVNFTQDLIDNIPPYAILSHTWGDEEVTYDDFIAGAGNQKAGYDKIEFCKQKAASDGLNYFWVDTCCIDKKNSNELSEAINPMFRWYGNAVKCYVLLLDVLIYDCCKDDQNIGSDVERAFQGSRWFTRGWTLQELIAPKSVEFFSLEGQKLGDKISLEDQIHDITGIPVQ